MKEILSDYPMALWCFQIFYFVGITLVAVKIIMDTKNTSKALAYLLLIIFLPFFGVIIYFLFGVNYRKNKFYDYKVERNEEIYQNVKKYIQASHSKVLDNHKLELEKYHSTTEFLFHINYSPLTDNNHVEILKNGEQKFSKVLEAIAHAKHHIHLEYYIFLSDNIGQAIGDLLIEKARNGVTVRLLYDDFGSGNIEKDFIKKMKSAGVEVSLVNKVNFKIFANRVNYRDHRKIIIIDGREVFTGGINVSDKYINDGRSQLYFRDTHLYIRGSATFYFQFLFFTNWMFATQMTPEITADYFNYKKEEGDHILQVAASGPDSKPSIMMSTVSAIYAAKQRIYITTPYFIPVDSVLQAIKQMAISGLDVRLLVPKKGDSFIVNAAAYSYYQEIMEIGVKIYFYEKGFVHAKTMIIDDDLSFIGTANMDARSQELNFEVNTLVYNHQINQEMTALFLDDLQDSSLIDLENWKKRSKLKIFGENLIGLFSPLL